MEPIITRKKVKFATQADPELLSILRNMAAAEGRQLQALVDEALRGYIERRQDQSPRRRVTDALEASLAQYDSQYRKLAQ